MIGIDISREKSVNAVLAQNTLGDECFRCGYAREVWSASLRKMIRCPQCTTVDLPLDPDALRRLARAERRRLRNKVAVAVVETIAQESRVFPRLPPELVTTDRVLDRWASFGTGMPAENPDAYRVALPPPLDYPTQLRVSDLVKLAEPRMLEVTYQVYPRGAPPSWVGEQLGMKPRTFGRFLHDILRVHKAHFLSSNYPDLVSLIRAQP